MKRMIVLAALIGLGGSTLLAGSSLTGSYVEARTAEVFTGGCVMNSEAGTAGRQAVLAWKIDRGSFNGVSLDGLSVVAALNGTANLGIYELGGERAVVRSSLFVDQRANPAQRLALVAMANDLSNGLLGSVVNVTSTPIAFTDNAQEVQVQAGQVALEVNKHVEHDPSCGAQLWFHPLSTLKDGELGLAEQHTYTGTNLGVKWSAPNQRSAFFGTFTR